MSRAPRSAELCCVVCLRSDRPGRTMIMIKIKAVRSRHSSGGALSARTGPRTLLPASFACPDSEPDSRVLRRRTRARIKFLSRSSYIVCRPRRPPVCADHMLSPRRRATLHATARSAAVTTLVSQPARPSTEQLTQRTRRLSCAHQHDRRTAY